MISSSEFMEGFMEKLDSGKLRIEAYPSEGNEQELTKEFIRKQIESYKELLNSGLLEIIEPKEETTMKLTPNKNNK